MVEARPCWMLICVVLYHVVGSGGAYEGDICLTDAQRRSIARKGSPIISRVEEDQIAQLLTTPSTREEGVKVLRR